jgi:uncharacterized membrane protein YdbT with pleckstrin-like domain
VAFPEDILTEGEHVDMHLHPHWKALIWPVVVLVLAIAGVAATAIWIGGDIPVYIAAAIGLILVFWLTVWPWLVWKTTHYVFTNERVLLQTGVFSRDRRDIPVSRINDHSMSQSFVERMLSCGTLTIESAGERGQSVLNDIPNVEKVQTRLYEIVERDRDAHSFNDDERAKPATPPVQA